MKVTSNIFTDEASAFWLGIARQFYYSYDAGVTITYRKKFGANELRLRTSLDTSVKALDDSPDNESGFYYPRAIYTFSVDDIFIFTFYTETKAAFRALHKPFQDLTIKNPVLTVGSCSSKELAVDMMEINWKLAAEPFVMKPHFYY